jgi:Phasin protein
VPEIIIKAINSTAPWEGYRKFAAAAGLEAATQAGAVWLRGMERLQDELAAMASAQMAASGAAAKELAACATIEDLLTTQVLLARVHFDRLSAVTTKISQISMTMAKESLAPISEGFLASTDQLIESLSH